LILIADLGATNARFCITEVGNEYRDVKTYPISKFTNLEELLELYLSDTGNLQGVNKAVIGVAAPILGDDISFVNVDLEFKISSLKKNLFTEGLTVVNDLALQAYAVSNLDSKDIHYIGERKITDEPKILVSPGTGLGLAGIVNNSVVSTEAGHINISDKVLRPDLKKIVDKFIEDNSRVPTYEDFLSGKGINFFYRTLSQNNIKNLTNEEILSNRKDENCIRAIGLQNYLLASYLRYVALVWGAKGGVLLAGSIVNSLIHEEDHDSFRSTFEDSETMKKFMQQIPLALLTIQDIGFAGGMELAKKL
jgi:glucokinase|tara:strand:- start:118 stop:1038 length:921 start_codon:yes stop_codon:yes gene_type:complete